MQANIVKINNPTNDETVYITVRMSGIKFEALRQYLHLKPGQEIQFDQYGSYMVKMGYGWYRVFPGKDFKAVQNMTHVAKILRLFFKWYEKETAADTLRALAPMPAVAYTSQKGYHDKTTVVLRLGDEKPKKAEPSVRIIVNGGQTNGVDPNKLSSLVNKFNSNKPYRQGNR